MFLLTNALGMPLEHENTKRGTKSLLQRGLNELETLLQQVYFCGLLFFA